MVRFSRGGCAGICRYLYRGCIRVVGAAEVQRCRGAGAEQVQRCRGSEDV